MGALLWFAKMLLKLLKPFVKLAVIEALIGAIGEISEETTVAEEETTVSNALPE